MNTIERFQDELSTWYESSSVSQFMRWWKAELKSLVPEKYREKLFPQDVLVYLTQENSEIVVWKNSEEGFEKYELSNDNHEWWHQVQHIESQSDGRQVKISFLLNADEVLVRKVALPQAAKDNLNEVIGFELDKYVPFKSEQVRLSYKVDKANSNEDKIVLDLAVIPNQQLADVLNLCDEKTIELDTLDVNILKGEQRPKNLGVNLLPVDKRKTKNYYNLKLNLALTAVLAGLVYFVMHTSIANKKAKIEQLTAEIEVYQKDAKTAKILRKGLKSAIISSKFLQQKKENSPVLVSIISEITSTLPDHSYISKFRLDKKKVEIVGLSDDANNLIPNLDKSKQWYSPEFQGPVSRDSKTGKDKFTIKAELQEPKLEEGTDNV